MLQSEILRLETSALPTENQTRPIRTAAIAAYARPLLAEISLSLWTCKRAAGLCLLQVVMEVEPQFPADGKQKDYGEACSRSLDEGFCPLRGGRGSRVS